MSSGPPKRVSPKDIQTVQNLIERCLQLYMTQREVVEILLAQAKIEPGFTELVWQKLEEENREFFNAYNLRLIVKRQITEFNKLLEQQVQLMRQLSTTGVAMGPTSTGSTTTWEQSSARYVPEHTAPALNPQNMHHIGAPILSNSYTTNGVSLNSSKHTAVEMFARANGNGASLGMMSMQNSGMGLMRGMNDGMIKPESSFVDNSFMFSNDGTVMEARPPLGDASVESLNGAVSNTQALNGTLLDMENASFGCLSQIPRTFSLTDLTAASDFPHSSVSDILEYPRSPFIATNAERFLDSLERDLQGDN